MIRLSLKYAALCVIAAVTLHGPALAGQASLALRSSIEIDTDTVSLADVIDGQDIPSTPVFMAPAPGQSGVIRTSRILEIAKQAGVTSPTGLIPNYVTVSRRGRKIGQEEIATAIKAAIAASGKYSHPDITVDSGAATSDPIIETGATGALRVEGLKIDSASLRFEARLRIDGSHILEAEPLKVTGRISDLVDMAILTKALSRGDLVTPDTYRIERRPLSALDGHEAPKISELGGLAVRDVMPIGAILNAEQLEKPMLVEKGGFVQVVYQAGGLSLMMRGKAIDAGSLGDTVSIQNQQSKKIVYGIVSGPGRVTIGAAPATLASNAPQNRFQ